MIGVILDHPLLCALMVTLAGYAIAVIELTNGQRITLLSPAEAA